MRTSAFLALLLAACSPSATDHVQTPAAATTAPAEPLDTIRRASIGARADTLLTAAVRHVFSSGATPDVFSLVLRGDSLLTSEATFSIATADGRTIFREVLTAAELEAPLVYEMQGPTASLTEREAFVRRRVREFFAEKNFRQPAVPAASHAPASLDRAAWDDLLRRPDAVSFQYLVGKEEQRRVAWSPLRKQVVRLL